MKNNIDAEKLSEREIVIDKCFRVIVNMIEKARSNKKLFRMPKDLFEISVSPYRGRGFSVRKEISINTSEAFMREEYDKLIAAAEKNFKGKSFTLQAKLYPYKPNRLIMTANFKSDGTVQFANGNVESNAMVTARESEKEEREAIKARLKGADRRQARREAGIVLPRKGGMKRGARISKKGLKPVDNTQDILNKYFPEDDLETADRPVNDLSLRKANQLAEQSIEKKVREEKSQVRAKVVKAIDSPDVFDNANNFEIEIVEKVEDSSFPDGEIPEVQGDLDSVRPESIRIATTNDVKSLVDQGVGQPKVTPLRVPRLDYGKRKFDSGAEALDFNDDNLPEEDNIEE